MAIITNFFGDLVESIYETFETDAANLVDYIHKELVEISPVETGTLVSNWKKGITPHSQSDNIRPKSKKKNFYLAPELTSVKTYGVQKKYYIWNNTPYLQFVNAGINPLVPDSIKVKMSKGFVQRGIKRGEARAAGLI